MWFYLYILVFLVNLRFELNCSAQQACTKEQEPSIKFVDNETVIASPSPAYSNATAIEKLEYWHIKYLGCAESERNLSVLMRNSNIIDNLEPYSQYGILISYSVNELACTKETTFNTTESDMLNDDEKPEITHNYTGTEALVSIKWDCQRLRGPISRSIEITCASQSCVGKTIQYRKNNETISTTDLSFGVSEQTRYILKLEYQRGEDSRSVSYDISIGRKKPHKVRNVVAYNINETSISIRWLPPDSLAGEIELYEIDYYSEPNETAKAQVDGSSHCKIWSTYICTTINGDKFLNGAYNFEIRAKYRENDEFGNYEPFFLSDDRERVPSKPLNVNYTWNKEILIIKWQHPDRPNGKILKFLIQINREIFLTHDVTEERLNYSQEVGIRDYNFIWRKQIIEIAAVNEIGSSSYAINPLKKPYFLEKPTLENITDSTFDVKLPPIHEVEGDFSKLYVIMTDLKSPIDRDELNDMDEELFTIVGANEKYSWIAGEFELRNITKLTIGSDLTTFSESDNTWTFIDRALERNHSYNVTFLLQDSYTGNDSAYALFSYYTLNFKTSDKIKEFAIEHVSDDFSYLWSLIIVPVLMGVFSAIVIIRRRRNQYFGLCQNYDSVANIYSLPLRPRIKDKINIYDKIILDDRDFVKLVKIQELDQYLKDAIENEELVRQYSFLPQGPMKFHDDGSQLPNRAKNRHHDLVAYDATRVKLNVIDGDPFSDYINASYIDGYNSQKAYIATQTPMDNTYSDFWRMIWQEKVKYIIIAADLNDEEREKGSGIYWPDINEEADFDDIKVVYRNIEVMANYEIRHFSIFCEHQERLVQQLHFFSMPEYSRVPLYIHSLASFIKKILSISDERSPIVVHCSDGISYTGIVILCDICLRMAIAEGEMDIFFQLYKLRKQRINMVSSVEIYKVVHFVLLRILECLKIPTETGVICDKTMERTIENILKTKIAQQMKYLEETSWQDKAMRDIDFLYDSIRSDGITDSEPTDSQLYRYSTIGDASIYITTTIVDSFTTPSKFVVTPKPLNATLGVFWQFIFTKRINVVLCLNKLSLIADLKETFNPYPGLDVKCYNQSISDYFKVYTLHANECNNQTDKLEVNIIHVLNWPSDSLHPENPNSLIMTYEEMNRLGKAGRPILVTCHDGVHASGLFVAMCFLIEKIRMEHICDVCLAVKSVQQSRKHYIRKVEQYTFLYLCALEYVRKFKTYWNFGLSMNDELEASTGSVP